MVRETSKILGDPDVKVHATCVRVPVLRTHAEVLNVEFNEGLSVHRANQALMSAAGVRVMEDQIAGRWAKPSDVAGKDEVFVGRVRRDKTRANTLDLWVVGDQLLKGAALNAVQCAELALCSKTAT